MLAVLLAAGPSLPSPAQQQRAAGTVYRVTYSVTATGAFATILDDELTLVVSSDDRYGMEGAAFAVDEDGWLLTARHVVDMEATAHDLCGQLRKHYDAVFVESIRLDMTLGDIVGNVWPSRFTVKPFRAGANVCTTGQVLVERESLWPVSVEKMDDQTDLALMKLTQSSGPVAALPFGTMADLHEWHPVYAFGFPGQKRATLTMISGLLVRSCEEHVATTPAPDIGPDLVRADIELLSRYVMEGRPGFSGGPVVAGDRLAGVTVRAGSTEADPERGISSIGLTYAIPADYVQAWYRWARGLSPDKPMSVCVPPPEPEGPPAPSK